MSFIKPILILFAFFGFLFYFQGPLKQVVPSFKDLNSVYSEPFKKAVLNLWNSTSTIDFTNVINYIPSSTTSSSTIFDPQNTEVLSEKANSTQAVSIVLNNTGELLPVTSNQKESTSLSIHGIIVYTNFERSKQGLPALRSDSKLTSSAESKLQDMFKNQYFQHVAPSGESVSDVVRREKYEYIVVGENLALGVFGGDDQVVAAWMASPGHKRNILDARYQDIGVAVGQGMYQGRKQWLIVQHFGKPLSSCFSPDVSVKQKIEIQKGEVSVLEAKIIALKPEIDKSTGDEYRTRAAEYNDLVAEYNEKLAQLKKSVDAYNDSVRSFNVCAGILNTN
jgi:uncharacterized protein YkwD